jgi:hypothetical protein
MHVATVDGASLASTTDSLEAINALMTPEAPAAPAAPEAPAAGDTPPAEQADEDVPPPDQDASNAGRQLNAHKRSLQGRINDLTGKWRQEQNAREALERELAALRTPPQPRAAPKPEDFQDYEQFDRAQTQHIADETYRSHRIAEQQQAAAARAQAEQDAVLRAHQDRIAQAKAELPDFEATVNKPIPISPELRHSILESDIGPHIAYHLGKHPEEAERLSQLAGSAALREIGKLEARLESALASSKPGPAQAVNYEPAPAPIKPVGGGATATKLPLDHPDVSFKEYEQRRAAGER